MNPQRTLFDRLAAPGVLYRYAPCDLERLAALVPDKGTLLEFGCGDGTIGAAIGGPGTFAFDLSQQCARLASHKGLVAVVADALAGLPFAANSFDTIYCVDVLHHLEQQWDRALAEIDFVLRAGGTLAIVEPDARNPFVRWTQAPRSPIRVAPYANEPAIHPETLTCKLQQAGYEVSCTSFHLEAHQVVRSVFPWWQRLLKAPFVLFFASIYRSVPNKFAIIARKPRQV